MLYKGNVLYFEGETNVQVLTFYTGPKSRKYVAICGMKLKKKITSSIYMRVGNIHSNVNDNTRAYPCHL